MITRDPLTFTLCLTKVADMTIENITQMFHDTYSGTTSDDPETDITDYNVKYPR